MLTLMSLLLLKHFIVDFPLQFPRHYLNKGTYGNYKGFEHSLLHGVATFGILLFFVAPWVAFIIAALEILAHYHIDWAKMNLNKHYNLTPTTSEQFWWLLGADQLAHQICYLAIVWILL